MKQRKNTRVAPSRKRRMSLYDPMDACGEVVVVASGGDNPDWLVGAN